MDFELEIEDTRKEHMEHNPFITLTDDTVITYSDLKTREDGREYITMYFETPSEENGFNSMNIEYPDGRPQNIQGYTPQEMERLLFHYNKLGELALEDARGDKNTCQVYN